MARTLFIQLLCVFLFCKPDTYANPTTALSIFDQFFLASALDYQSAAKVDIHFAFGKDCSVEFEISSLTTYSRTFSSNFSGRDTNDLKSVNGCIAELQMLINEYNVEPDSDLFFQTDRLILKIASMDSSFHRSINELLYLDGSQDLGFIPNLSTQLFVDSKSLDSLLQTFVQANNQEGIREVVTAPVFVFKDKRKVKASILTAEHLSMIQIKKLRKNGTYKLILTTFSEYEDATTVVQHLKDKTNNNDMQILIDKKGDYRKYEILIQGFTDRDEAAAYLEELAGLGIQ